MIKRSRIKEAHRDSQDIDDFYNHQNNCEIFARIFNILNQDPNRAYIGVLPNGEIRHATPAALDLLGCKERDILGKYYSTLLSKGYQADDFASVEENRWFCQAVSFRLSDRTEKGPFFASVNKGDMGYIINITPIKQPDSPSSHQSSEDRNLDSALQQNS